MLTCVDHWHYIVLFTLNKNKIKNIGFIPSGRYSLIVLSQKKNEIYIEFTMQMNL